jgi:hypothetical protein
MLKHFAAALMSSVLLALPANAAVKPQIQWDKQYDFSHVKTFKWQPPAAASLAEIDPFMHKFIEDAIEKELTAAGLTKTDAIPDVYVTYHGSIETEVQMRSTSFGYSVGGYGGTGWGMYGYSMGPTSTSTRAVETQKGTLIVDIWDPTQEQLVWRGAAPGILISDDKAKTQQEVQRAITAMAKQNRKLRAKEASAKK